MFILVTLAYHYTMSAFLDLFRKGELHLEGFDLTKRDHYSILNPLVIETSNLIEERLIHNLILEIQ